MPSNVIALHNDEVMNMAGGAKKRAKVRKSKPSKTKKTKVKKSKPSKTKKSKSSKGSKRSKGSKKSKGSKSMKGGKRKLPEALRVRNENLV